MTPLGANVTMTRYRKEARKNSTEVTVWRFHQSFLPCQLTYRFENLKASTCFELFC
jgi:hypothetical protein